MAVRTLAAYLVLTSHTHWDDWLIDYLLVQKLELQLYQVFTQLPPPSPARLSSLHSLLHCSQKKYRRCTLCMTHYLDICVCVCSFDFFHFCSLCSDSVRGICWSHPCYPADVNMCGRVTPCVTLFVHRNEAMHSPLYPPVCMSQKCIAITSCDSNWGCRRGGKDGVG